MIHNVFPRIRALVPEASLTVVGAGVPHELRRFGETIPGVSFTGEVPDVRDYVRRASLVLNYVESGGGIALKVLEAMAMRKPVLSNPLGVEGIELTPGLDVSVRDGPAAFAEGVALLLRDPAQRASLANQGYETVRRNYSCAALTRRFEKVLGGAGRAEYPAAATPRRTPS